MRNVSSIEYGICNRILNADFYYALIVLKFCTQIWHLLIFFLTTVIVRLITIHNAHLKRSILFSKLYYVQNLGRWLHQSEPILNQIFLVPGVVLVKPATWPSLGWQ